MCVRWVQGVKGHHQEVMHTSPGSRSSSSAPLPLPCTPCRARRSDGERQCFEGMCEGVARGDCLNPLYRFNFELPNGRCKNDCEW